MNEIHDLLAHAVDEPIHVDPTADVRRGRRALNRRRTRLAAGVTGGLVAVSAAGYAALPTHSAAVREVAPVADPGPTLVQTQYFAFATPPTGWHVVGAEPSAVMIAQDGTAAQLDGSFVGKVMILLEDKSWPMGYGTAIPFNGRTFFDNEQGGDDMSILAVQDPGGDWVQVQYPRSAGFGRDAMLAFLDSVVVEPDAVGGKG
jgi:hypothetical protein